MLPCYRQWQKPTLQHSATINAIVFSQKWLFRPLKAGGTSDQSPAPASRALIRLQKTLRGASGKASVAIQTSCYRDSARFPIPIESPSVAQYQTIHLSLPSFLWIQLFSTKSGWLVLKKAAYRNR